MGVMSTGHQFEKPEKLNAKQEDAVRSALESVISSPAFAGSKRCQDFLRLVVERTLEGDLDSLRERQIGVEMFGRPADYDTSNDAVVRVRATEVRRRLAQYHREVSPTLQVRIELPPGSYVPEFHWSSQAKTEAGEPTTVPVALAPQSRWRMPTIAVFAVIVIVSLLLLISLRHSQQPQPMNAVRLSLGLPQGVTLHRNWHPFEHFALSPDGEMLAFAATDASGQSSLWIRPLSSSEALGSHQPDQ